MEIIIAIWIVCGVIAAIIGNQKGEGGMAFIAGFLLGPIGIIGALFSRGNRPKCPYCMSLIDLKASVCPQCRRSLPSDFASDKIKTTPAWFWIIVSVIAIAATILVFLIK